MNEFGKSSYSFRLPVVKWQILNPSDYFVHELIVDGKNHQLACKEKLLSGCELHDYSVLEPPYLVISKELKFRFKKNKFSDTVELIL